MPVNRSDYNFDPTYGYTLKELFRVKQTAEPSDYESFWRHRLSEALSIAPHPEIIDTGITRDNLRVFTLYYRSTNQARIGGWLCLPASGEVKRGFIIGHGYGGREEPDFHLPFNHDSALLFLCCRGISKSPYPSVSSQPHWHVLHDIDKPKHYILRGCVEDTWIAVSSLLRLFPHLSGHIGLLGISFSGGIGAMALAWDKRIQKAHFNVPSFGNNPLRMALKTTGSAASVQLYCKRHPEIVLNTLSYYDAAIAAKYIDVPTHIAAAKYDPVVAPPGQFAIYNALNTSKTLYVLEAGHTEYQNQSLESEELLEELSEFFADL
ncbi:acetylxylan esterase [Catenovulum sediminis]|uniref:Acetylxylan esterase n=1 Tax=Catenovulum sediminis TaxID=1740262 RepID=A0ABV1RJC2_9ALTE|nr:acetylxylan esterase [Catenovulum sediminis]